MRNIYVVVGIQEEASEIETQRQKNGAWSIPGCCWWTDPNRNVHSFDGLDDKNHSPIYAKLGEIHRKLLQKDDSRYLHWWPQMVVDENMVCGHNDKLSIVSKKRDVTILR